jgi:hypothetical protein
MPQFIDASARPEKRLFISLITRDISLIDALLDIIDNSINAALEPLADHLSTADDYQKLLGNNRQTPKVAIEVKINSSRISVTDNASGISWRSAKDHVFKFGRADEEADPTDRLSVYGIGLKRAMFKCGNKIRMKSDHKDGGFTLDLDVATWARDKKEPWTFQITDRPGTRTNRGTTIRIEELYEDVQRRLSDGVFVGNLRERIARTYSFFIGRVVTISVNGTDVEKESFDMGENFTSEKFKLKKVSCSVTAGLATSTSERFKDRNAGWYVFCNGRAVLFADKSQVTGWGAGLPIFQPKHRPFLGTIFFVSPDPEALPWTTTKGAVNEDNAAWQQAKIHMITVGKIITGFLDRRYTDDGTDVAPSDLQEAAGRKVNVLSAAVARDRQFKTPKKSTPDEVKIQYSAKVKDVKKIERYLKRPSMGGSEVGRYTFRHYLENEVGSDE